MCVIGVFGTKQNRLRIILVILTSGYDHLIYDK